MQYGPEREWTASQSQKIYVPGKWELNSNYHRHVFLKFFLILFNDHGVKTIICMLEQMSNIVQAHMYLQI